MDKVKVLNILNEFLQKFDASAVLEDEFCYRYSTSEIGVAFEAHIQPTKDFLKSVYIYHPQIQLDAFMWSFLHELGHHETMDDLEAWEEVEIMETKEKIKNGELDESLYYTMKDEILATAWAVGYAEANYFEISDLAKKIRTEVLQVV